MSEPSDRRLVSGMVGGGPGAMNGAAHRHAMWLDNQYVLAAGIFGRDRHASAAFAEGLGIERVYDDYGEMAEQEAAREDSVDVVAVVTPNDTHFEIARAFLEAGTSGCAHSLCPTTLTRRPRTSRSPSRRKLSSRSRISIRPTRSFGMPHGWCATASSP